MPAAPQDDARRSRVVALRHDRDAQRAPTVVAKGQGELAERILEQARRHDIPMRQDADLIEMLCACDVGEEIPSELYAPIAELLAFLYRLNAETAAR